MSAADGLEARYRRLMRFYPAWYRARHGEELLDVLMTAATPGQRRPGAHEMADLLWSGPTGGRPAGRPDFVFLRDRGACLARFGNRAPSWKTLRWQPTVLLVITTVALRFWEAGGLWGLLVKVPYSWRTPLAPVPVRAYPA